MIIQKSGNDLLQPDFLFKLTSKCYKGLKPHYFCNISYIIFKICHLLYYSKVKFTKFSLFHWSKIISRDIFPHSHLYHNNFLKFYWLKLLVCLYHNDFLEIYWLKFVHVINLKFAAPLYHLMDFAVVHYTIRIITISNIYQLEYF